RLSSYFAAPHLVFARVPSPRGRPPVRAGVPGLARRFSLRYPRAERRMRLMSEHHTPGALNARQLTTLAALADTLIPRGGRFPLGAAEADPAGTLSRSLMLFAPARRRAIAGLIGAWEYSTVLSRHLAPFSRLDAAQRQLFVQQALHSRAPWRRYPLILLAH